MCLTTLLQSSIWDIKFSQIEGNSRQFRHIGLSSNVIKFTKILELGQGPIQFSRIDLRKQ